MTLSFYTRKSSRCSDLPDRLDVRLNVDPILPWPWIFGPVVESPLAWRKEW